MQQAQNTKYTSCMYQLPMEHKHIIHSFRKHPKATCKILNMHPKSQNLNQTVHLCQIDAELRCSVSHTTSWTGLSTSLVDNTIPQHASGSGNTLQGMHEHHIFHSPNAHKQKTYITHIFPNMSFFHPTIYTFSSFKSPVFMQHCIC